MKKPVSLFLICICILFAVRAFCQDKPNLFDAGNSFGHNYPVHDSIKIASFVTDTNSDYRILQSIDFYKDSIFDYFEISGNHCIHIQGNYTYSGYHATDLAGRKVFCCKWNDKSGDTTSFRNWKPNAPFEDDTIPYFHWKLYKDSTYRARNVNFFPVLLDEANFLTFAGRSFYYINEIQPQKHLTYIDPAWIGADLSIDGPFKSYLENKYNIRLKNLNTYQAIRNKGRIDDHRLHLIELDCRRLKTISTVTGSQRKKPNCNCRIKK